jgi:pimeloyl-ACP methyl ester carboxylesterase
VAHETVMLPTRFGRTHVVVWGDQAAPPLLLLHGATNCALMWSYLAAELGRGFRVYAPDVPGDVGKSAPTRPIARLEEYDQWLVDLLDAARIKSAFVAGISWGGGIALSAAMSNPDRVSRVVAMCPAWGLAIVDGLALLRHAVPLALFPSRRRLVKTLRWFSAIPGAFSGASDARFVDYLALAMKGRRKTPQPRFRVFSEEELRSIRVPTLVLIGEREVIYQDVRAVAERARLIPDVRVEIVPGASHGMFYDRPDIVPGMIAEFLAGRKDPC